ncbi:MULTISPECIES: rhomboid family intramembrane serine protease [Cyanophyceae]|uniref:Rhomboid family intramembrane serine protease n=1 Tax=Leptolyngbya subtilissima DQ-A4 TaxID=2933933 RepID=A0ABV0KBX4_9CYAN|nr:rhomboid family intramembrane serine protease [Nodosilinea sp. FACHB-141]MBD2113377.1 rhomboid family intramembrane serine protease [Nodosilinea sp. FACHB-141]
MVPLHDDNPTTITPVVTYGLIGINIAVFVFQLSLSQEGIDGFFDAWALVPAQLTGSFQGALQAPIYEWITLLSSQFLHGGFFHIGGNLLYLWVFGNNIEDRLGHIKFLIFYLGCGALAGLTQWIFDPSSALPTIGASGAIAGVMGAYILRFPRARIVTLIPLIIIFTTVRIPAVFFLGFWFVQQALFSIASLGSDAGSGGGVAYWAHSGGFVFGLILGPLLGLMGGKVRSPRR